MDDTPPTPPATLPDDLVEAVNDCSPVELDALAEYAESLALYRAASREGDEAAVAAEDAEAGADETCSTETDGQTHGDNAAERPPDVPAKASTTVKEINGNRYYYWQWRDGDRIRSQYKGPVEGEQSS